MRYLQLTHTWDPATKTSRPKVLHSFGREDQLDREAIKRLVASLTRLLDPATALTASTNSGPAGLAFTSSRPVGGTLVLDALGAGSGSTPSWRDYWKAASVPAHGAGAVRAGREPGAGAGLEAGRRRMDLSARARRGPARDQRRTPRPPRR